MVEDQIRAWDLARTARLQTPTSKRPEVEGFIAISRTVGAGGRDVATRLGEALGWPIFDRGILQRMTGDPALRRAVTGSLTETDQRWREQKLEAVIPPLARGDTSFLQLVEIVLSLARQGRAIFLGRGVDLILPRRIGLRVRLVAPPDTCASNFGSQNRIPLRQAREQVTKLESDRAEFIRRFFDVDPDDPTRHDLTINTARIPRDHAVKLILDAGRRVGLANGEAGA